MASILLGMRGMTCVSGRCFLRLAHESARDQTALSTLQQASVGIAQMLDLTSAWRPDMHGVAAAGERGPEGETGQCLEGVQVKIESISTPLVLPPVCSHFVCVWPAYCGRHN